MDITFEESEPFHFSAPGLLVISGATGVGKSYLCKQIVKFRNEIIKPKPDVVLWVYNIFQDALFKEVTSVCPNVIFLNGMEEFFKYQLSQGLSYTIVLD